VAPLPVIPDIARVAFNWTNNQNAQVATNVMHFVILGDTPAGLYAEIDSHVAVNMWGQTIVGASVDNVVITPLDGSSLSKQFFTGKPAKWSGAVGTTEYIPQVAAIVKLGTDERGRSKRGRVYLPWCAETAVAAGSLATTTKSNMQSAWDTFRAAMKTGNNEMVVASYKNISYLECTTTSVELLLATQRRRQPRR
jgi:hypothetical protein